MNRAHQHVLIFTHSLKKIQANIMIDQIIFHLIQGKVGQLVHHFSKIEMFKHLQNGFTDSADIHGFKRMSIFYPFINIFVCINYI